MRAYELRGIVGGSLAESAAHSWVGTITKSITAAGGSVHGTPDWWGRRRLAYPIKKSMDGYYAVFNVLAPGGGRGHGAPPQRRAADNHPHKHSPRPPREAARRGMVATA